MASREVRRFDIVFRDPTGIFKAGDVVAGNVQLDLGADLKMKGVKFFLQGISRVNWDEKRAYTKGASGNVSHKNVDVYLDEPLFLLSRDIILTNPGHKMMRNLKGCQVEVADSSDTPLPTLYEQIEGNVLRAGRYDWPFTLRLPPYIPASFEGQYGRVQYWAKAVLDQPWKKDTEITKPFTVAGTLDLNTENEAKVRIYSKPAEATGEVMVGPACCPTGPIKGSLSLPNRGFVSGQNVPFSVSINNGSSKGLRDVHVTLVQQVLFRADKQQRRQNTILKGMTWRDVNPGETGMWDDELKGIPAVVPSRLGAGCKSIDVKYVVSLTGRPKGPGKPLEVSAEVIIGTVPLRKTESTTPILTVKAAARHAKEGLSLPTTSRGQMRASPRPSPEFRRK